MDHETITLLELNNRISRAVLNDRGTQSVWITAELSDVSTKNGHTYMELIQKDSAGVQVAKARAMIWRSCSDEIVRFQQATGQMFCSGIKLKVLASATMHPVFGLSLNITRIDAAFTIGDLLIRRREILEQLKKQGIIDDNKNLEWDPLSLNVAVISASSAAGYGDFMNHIQSHAARFRYNTRLFPSLMQGERAVPSVLEALDSIENELDSWNCVVIIRGGGATSDLAAFESYELAYRVATFPLPVIVGIGHERDTTVLDFVANRRVKTPTAAADMLVQHWTSALEQLNEFSRSLSLTVKDKVATETVQLSYLQSNLINLTANAVKKAETNLQKITLMVESVCSRAITPALQKLHAFNDKLNLLSSAIINSKTKELDGMASLIEALSPQSVLRRGYTMTLVDGKTVKTKSQLPPRGSVLTTVFIDGSAESILQ